MATNINTTPVLVIGTAKLGYMLCDWHSSGSDPIYATGSAFIAGKGVPLQVAKDAYRNLVYSMQDEYRARRDRQGHEAGIVVGRLRVCIRAAQPGWGDDDD